MQFVPESLASSAAKSASHLSKKLKLGGGTTIGGLVLNHLRPSATAEMAQAMTNGVILVSGTNGKTTTTRLIRAALDASGHNVVSNTAGSNLERGVTTALLHTDAADIGLFEVDEAALAGLSSKTKPKVVVLLNLFRDQLDRYGELEHLVELWRESVSALPCETTLVYNADDPGLAYIAANHERNITFGIDDPRLNRSYLPHAVDSTRCRGCRAAQQNHATTCTPNTDSTTGVLSENVAYNSDFAYDILTIAHLGRWSCVRCQQKRPQLAIAATKVELHGLSGQRLAISTPQGPTEVSLRLPGLHNSYNALAAVGCAVALALNPIDVGAALAKRQAAFGRAERITINSTCVTTLLAKNPTGANENIHTLLLQDQRLHLLLLLNDRTADGQDISWIWDVDYELLLANNRLGTLTIGGDRAYDMALRFRYGGVDANQMRVISKVADAFDAALTAAGANSNLYVLPTYTALLELQELLTKRGVTPPYWEDS